MNSGERQKSNVELGEKNEWSELEELARDGFISDNVNEGVRTETPEEKQEKISQAAMKVREAYKKMILGNQLLLK